MEAIKNRKDLGDYQEFLRKEFMISLAADDVESGELPTPRAVIVIGVNGVGKTTSIAKLAHYHRQRGKKVILAAADTFRAAAQDSWAAGRSGPGVEMIGHEQGATRPRWPSTRALPRNRGARTM